MKNSTLFFIYLKELENIEYESKYEILNAIHFGIPQKKERIFVVSCLGANKFSFNKFKKKLYLKWTDIKQLLDLLIL
ncbi:DNA cytosine methyltransferase [Ureaplasma parvum]|nr:DNA cytosine methyltransferase [Ureaplasma parvum]